MGRDFSALTLRPRGRPRFWLLFAVCTVFIMHVAIGTNPAVLCIAMLTVLLGIYPVSRYGLLNIGALLCLLVVFRYIGFPIIGKLLFLQPLDSNLDRPIGAFTVVLIGVFSYLIAFLAVMKLNLKRTILEPVSDPDRLRHISILAMIVGCVANGSVALHAGTQYTGITVANFFVPFLHLALISAIAAELNRSGGHRSWSYWVLLIIAAEVAFALVRNSRMALVEVILCYVVTLTAFNCKVRWGRTLAAGLFAFLIVTFMTPVILNVREVRNQLTWAQRITATIKIATDWHSAYEYYKAFQSLKKREGFYLNYYGSPQNILERMSLINHVDVLKSASDKHRTVGFKDLEFAIKRILPRILVPDKPIGYSQGSWLYCEANVECIEGSYATAPLIANGYAAFGWLGAISYPIILGSVVLLIVKLISGFDLRRNVWAIYLFIRIHEGFVEGDITAYLQSMIRDFPQDLIILSAIFCISGIVFSGLRRPVTWS